MEAMLSLLRSRKLECLLAVRCRPDRDRAIPGAARHELAIPADTHGVQPVLGTCEGAELAAHVIPQPDGLVAGGRGDQAAGAGACAGDVGGVTGEGVRRAAALRPDVPDSRCVVRARRDKRFTIRAE